MDKTGTRTTESKAEAAHRKGYDSAATIPPTEAQQRQASPQTRNRGTTRYITVIEGESATDTSMGNDTDINNIVARFDRTGILPSATTQPIYADVTALQGELTELINEARDVQQRSQEFIEKWKPPVANSDVSPPITTNPPTP